MTYIFKLPDVGEGMAEGEIVKWYVKVGDTIQEDEPLLELQNDKLLQEIPSPVTGVIKQILVDAGTTAQVGEALIEIETDQVQADSAPEAPATTEPETKAPVAPVVEKTTPQVATEHVLAMPSVRQYAFSKDIDLTKINGTGHQGQVTKADIDNYVNEPVVEKTKTVRTETTTQVVQNFDEDQYREKLSTMRKAIAKTVSMSSREIPHVTLFDEVEVNALVKHRNKYKEVAAQDEIKLTYLPYFVKALTLALKRYPVLNASFDQENEEIIYNNYFNIGVAVDTEAGLFVPNVKNADQKGIFSIAREIGELALKSHERTLAGDDMKHGSMTISNIGSARGSFFTPIINYPEAAILGVGSIVKKPIVAEDDTITIGYILSLSLSFDHRIVDGMTAQLFMNELKRFLNDPELLLMEG